MADASVGVGFLGGSVHIRFPERLLKKLPIDGSGMADASVGVGFLGGSAHIRLPARLRTGTEFLSNKSRQL